MEKIAVIKHILDTRLTTDTLDKIYPQTKALEDVLLSHEDLIERHKTVRIDLLELIGSIIEKETGEPVKEDAFQLVVMERVDNFLTHRGFHYK